MPAFSAHDGTKLAYHVFGDGPPVVCLPGGPTDSAYLSDLGDADRFVATTTAFLGHATAPSS
ncbi:MULTISPECIES: alpha/beta fold hydrolase [unclassified Streptomyces]|uniref:alpha/beta fold hydrolase n=1 Tax=unclassified Streptomyces TaxID=2593676 RepID=UPI0036E993D0